MNSYESEPRRSPRHPIVSDIKSIQKDPLILLIDKKLTKNESLLLNTHLSVYYIEDKDCDKWLFELPKCDLYVVRIGQKMYNRSTRSHGLLFYELNKLFLPEKTKVFYYRTRSYLNDEDISSLDSTYLIRSFPKYAKDKKDLINRLSHQALPEVDNCLSICCKCLLGKYTCSDFYRNSISLICMI